MSIEDRQKDFQPIKLAPNSKEAIKARETAIKLGFLKPDPIKEDK